MSDIRTKDDVPPVLAGFVPSLVRIVRSERQEQTQTWTAQSEWIERKADHHETLNERSLLYTRKVREPTNEGIVNDDERGDGRRREDLGSDASVHSAAERGVQVAEETIRRAMLHPVVMGVNGAAVLARFLSV